MKKILILLIIIIIPTKIYAEDDLTIKKEKREIITNTEGTSIEEESNIKKFFSSIIEVKETKKLDKKVEMVLYLLVLIFPFTYIIKHNINNTVIAYRIDLVENKVLKNIFFVIYGALLIPPISDVFSIVINELYYYSIERKYTK